MIYVLLADGFEEIEALTVVDILRRADIPVELVSVNKTNEVSGAHGIKVTSDINISEVKNYKMIFLPGGYPGYENLENSDKVREIITEANLNGKYLAAICAAPSILGKMGLLKGKTACCFPGFEEQLTDADVVYDEVVLCDKIITSRGAGTAHKLGFKIVEMFKGRDVSDKLASAMIYECSDN